MTAHTSDTPAGDLEEFQLRLERALDTVAVETQPRIAARILDLVQDPDSQLREFGDVIRNDAALTGRLLKLANSAYFAQRSPVSKPERALVLLGLERVKSISLGFYLCRSATSAGSRELSREVWGQSVFRACLCGAMARVVCPEVASEAFVIGLMLDCGIPLMASLTGPAYEPLFRSTDSPQSLFESERANLEFTHVDIVTALVRRWKLPPMLAKPIVWHHAQPAPIVSDGGPPPPPLPDPLTVLQRIAFYCGQVRLDAGCVPAEAIPLPEVGCRVLGLPAPDLSAAVGSAVREFGAISQMFSDVAGPLANVDAIAEAAHRQLIDAIDTRLVREFAAHTRDRPASIDVAGLEIRYEPAAQGQVRVLINSDRGEPLVVCEVDPRVTTPGSLRRSLGLDEASDLELRRLAAEIKSLAA
ncbi:MAG: HDOD domain-containing protein [Phycisphaeraceae bacterium]|nr:HDOD domain-containing protein [Phycisphaeraceae bacterium]